MHFLSGIAMSMMDEKNRDELMGIQMPPISVHKVPRIGEPAPPLQRALERAEVRDAVATLPERDREVVSLRFQRGLSYAEIAKVTGATPAAVKQRAWRALRRLRDVLEPQ